MAEDSTTNGRYVIASEIATGGMATVYLGRMRGAVGFARTVAIKKLHPQFAKDPEFVGMFVDEARLVARIQHPNVVQTFDVVVSDGEVLLVMEYIAGETLSRIVRSLPQGTKIPMRIGCSIVAGVLHGLHAAHGASDESGDNLNIVHRDVSPQNIVVGADGVPRVLDFGVAKAVSRMQTTGEGRVKGKLSYMAPEQLLSLPVSHAADLFSAGVVLWEVLTGERLLKAANEGELMKRLLDCKFMPPSLVNPASPLALDEITLKALDRSASNRYATAREMALEIERVAGTASATEIADWLKSVVGAALDERAATVRSLEKRTASRVTVENVIGSVRESTSVILTAPRTRDEEMAPVPIHRPVLDGDSMTGKPVTSPSFPKAQPFQRQRRSLFIALAMVALVVVVVVGGAMTTRHLWSGASHASSHPPAETAPPIATAPHVETPLHPAATEATTTPPTPSSSAASSSAATTTPPPPPRVVTGVGAAPRPVIRTRPGTTPNAEPAKPTGDPYDSLGGRR